MNCLNIRDRFAGRRVVVMGLGSFGGGIGVSRFLARAGAQVLVTDLRSREQLSDSLAQLSDLQIEYHLGGHCSEDFTAEKTDLVVVNPAVKKNSAYLGIARDNGLELTSEMNLFFELCTGRIVAVTGSNGKSTTTAMIQAILQQGKSDPAALFGRVWIGGNLGSENLLCRLEEISADDVVVLELSSFQLHDLAMIKRSPEVAVLTNIAPNHLDWHESMEKYIRAKQNILRFQKSDGVAVLNRLDSEIVSWSDLAPGRVVWYPDESGQQIELQIPGSHNQLNASAAIATAGLFGVQSESARQALRNFTGLPHRLELIREFQGVRYYNDSIATTPESVIAALNAFGEDKAIILGGYDKKISFEGLIERLVGTGDVRFVALLGQMRHLLAEQIESRKQALGLPGPDYLMVDSLEQAVREVRSHSQEGMVALLSPGCASYDMFENFQDRGRQFCKIVENLE
ncbi:MAG: UDP-N-acetylmuramoyl-L-alanine--D-glutamate ligase [Sedimentisphaerales bacterium]|nr:UDP-N-acetylmuramoyl-L-alanine--D-glutamate ligase [Sedimentisphaerales bacterium]